MVTWPMYITDFATEKLYNFSEISRFIRIFGNRFNKLTFVSSGWVLSFIIIDIIVHTCLIVFEKQNKKYFHELYWKKYNVFSSIAHVIRHSSTIRQLLWIHALVKRTGNNKCSKTNKTIYNSVLNVEHCTEKGNIT